MHASVTRTVSFTASHRYWKPEWTEEENRARFGKVVHAHPHEYRCAVTVSGPLQPDTAMVMDLAQLDRLIQTHVIARLADKSLDREVPEFAGGKQLPTCEAIALDLFGRLSGELPTGVVLERVQVTESDALSASVSRGS
jgi:6-pyruvoyltetrahydropterin/6-carboxytetrahydropterin synthase